MTYNHGALGTGMDWTTLVMVVTGLVCGAYILIRSVLGRDQRDYDLEVPARPLTLGPTPIPVPVERIPDEHLRDCASCSLAADVWAVRQLPEVTR